MSTHRLPVRPATCPVCHAVFPTHDADEWTITHHRPFEDPIVGIASHTATIVRPVVHDVPQDQP